MKKRIISICCILHLFGLISIAQSDTLELPFFEDWSSHSFETNGWTIEGDGWLISNHIGEPLPCAEFRTTELNTDSIYSSVLLSQQLIANQIEAGYIYLDFHLQLINTFETGQEKLKVEIYNDSLQDWQKLIVISNVLDINFEDGFYHINISDDALGKNFLIRFVATGVNPMDLESWFIDNIHIYNECAPPTALEGSYFYDMQNWGVVVSWNAPELPEGPNNWIQWDDGVFTGGVGTLSGGSISVAHRWDAGQLKDWNGVDWSDLSIGKVSVFMHDNGFDNMVIKIWSGPNAETLLYAQEVENPVSGDWVEYVLNEPVEFDVNEELWVGYYIDQFGSYFPFGYDNGPAIAGYGDMITTNGINWDPMSMLGIDNNFLIHACSQNGLSLLPVSSFNIYREEVGVQDDYVLYDNVEYSAALFHYHYQDPFPNVSSGQLYNYMVTANWTHGGDSCESQYAMNVDESEDFVSVLVTGLEDEKTITAKFYPNPFTNRITFEYILDHPTWVEITIFNHLYQQVEVIQQYQSIGNQQVSWDASAHHSGIYFFRMQLEQRSTCGKMILIK